MNSNPFDLYTHTPCGDGGGDIPDWMFYAIAALPFALLALGLIA